MDINLSKLREIVKDRKAWRAATHGVAESDMNEQLDHNKGALRSSSRVQGTWGHLLSLPFPQPGSPWAAWTVLGSHID